MRPPGLLYRANNRHQVRATEEPEVPAPVTFCDGHRTDFASARRKPESDDLYVIIGKAGTFIGRT
jgi:hypothetical protein